MLLFPEKNAFGLDISESSLRLIQVAKSGKKYNIISQNEISLPTGIIENSYIKDSQSLANNIKKLVATAKGKKIKTSYVITVLPESKTFIKLINVYITDTENIPQALAQEMTKHIPFSLNEIYFDWQIIGKFKPNSENKVLIGAAPIETVDSYVHTIKDAGFIPLAIEIEASAITRAIFPLNDSTKVDEGRIIIDLGASRSSFIVYHENLVHFTMSLPVSGKDITKNISEKLQIDYNKAEEAKVLCGLDEEKCSGALRKVLVDNINNLIKKIEEAVYFYEESVQNKSSIKSIILVGGGSQLIGLDAILSEKFQIPILLANPLCNISQQEKSAGISKKKLSSFATAIGLALRGNEYI